MKGKNSFWLIILLVHLQSIVYSQSIETTDSIHWCSDYRLQWTDFKGKVPQDVGWNAVCSSHISAVGYYENKMPNYRVINYFVKSESWARDTTSSLLLEHERLHFDISEIFARKISQAVDSLREKHETKVSVYTRTVNSWLDVWDKWTDAYDEETSHGLRPSKQEEWAIKIQKELSALEKYATKCPPDTP